MSSVNIDKEVILINEKILQIGSKLNISAQDIKDIQNHNTKNSILSPITGGIIAILSTILGFFIGMTTAGCTNCNGYPFASAGLASTAQKTGSKKYLTPAVIITALVSIMGFAVAYSVAQNMFGYGIMYDVYKKEVIR
ncbi:MAG: hypothetical protein ABIG84_01990 [archaeon]